MYQRLSLRTTQGLTIIVMGVLAVVLALTTGEVYRHLAVANQRTALGELMGHKARDLLGELETKSRDVGLQLQHDADFRDAFDRRDRARLTAQLHDQFHQYFVTAGILKLERIEVRDHEFRLLAASYDEGARWPANTTICPNLIQRARNRSGPDRLKTMSELCLYQDRPYQSVMVPIGGLRVRGYVEVITDPAYALQPIETALGMPLQMTLASGEVTYQSIKWPPNDALSNMLIASYSLVTPAGQAALTVAVANDMQALNAELQATRYWIVLVDGIATVIATLLALAILQRTAVAPLQHLKRHMLAVRNDRKRIGEPVAVQGNSEINDLADGFNVLGAELKGLYQTLERMAYTDSLTQLPNRARFQESLALLTHAALNPATPFALVLIDLDRFKEVNDSFGHDVGDQLLKEVGARLKGALRRSDVLLRLDSEATAGITNEALARLGGDEFAAVLLGVDSAERAASVVQKLTKALEPAFHIAGHTLHMRMSAGIALYPEHGKDPMTLLQQADMAMYYAKQRQSGYAVSDSTRHAEWLARVALERDLREALETGGLELHYQPKTNVGGGSVCCAEALIRWRHPERGMIPPDQFIPIAEQTGLIHELTRWVLDRALEQCAAWHRAGHAIGVGINISAANLRDPQLAQHVDMALRKWNVAATALTLELTESAVMDDADHALQVLSRLDAMGVRLSIDDFGTGYSSLLYLKQLPVDEIKIDRSFVKNMEADNNDAIIVRSTIDLAHNMGLRVVAEGVENEATLKLLQTLGCDLAQGYFISRPVPYDTFVAWLNNARACDPCVPKTKDESGPICYSAA